MKVNNYVLEIMQPGELNDVWVSLSSDTPYLAINVGDYISPAFTFTHMSEQKEPNFKVKGAGLIVSKIEHLVGGGDGGTISHKITVFTTEADNPRV